LFWQPDLHNLNNLQSYCFSIFAAMKGVANRIISRSLSTLLFASFPALLFSQVESENEQGKRAIDSLYIIEVQDAFETDKVLHAEPLYIDLIRDLGARKGEKEWNIGIGLQDRSETVEYEALVEYEWAPVNRLGLEVELPFTLYFPGAGETWPGDSKLNSIKLAAQYTFLVSERVATSLAVGYLHEFKLTTFRRYGKENLFRGNLFNPFFIAAKRWGNNFHTLLYTGPSVFQAFNGGGINTVWEAHSSFHYMIPGTRNFIGIEVNKEFWAGFAEVTLRPQMRVSIAENLLIGIVTGIPVIHSNARFSSFLRIIYEPSHKVK
jgi:hypothetical protein